MLRTTRDEDILRTLAHRVPILSFRQLARAWWPEGPSGRTNARRRLDALIEERMLEASYVLAAPQLELREPVSAWQPGGAPPSFEAVSHRLKSRWTAPPQTTLVYLASRRAVNLLGGLASGRLDHPLQAGHDLHVGALYLKLRAEDPKLATHWVSEEQLKHDAEPFEVVPDAAIRDEDGRVTYLLEFGGAYDAERLERIHEHAAALELPYEIW